MERLTKNILCWVVCKPIKILCLPNMKSARDEEFENVFLEVFTRESRFCDVDPKGKRHKVEMSEKKTSKKTFQISNPLANFI